MLPRFRMASVNIIALLETCQCCFCFLTAHVAALDHRIVFVGYQYSCFHIDSNNTHLVGVGIWCFSCRGH
ncbi:hypothetical protein BYT27DRAFT_6807694 [Phlegmacium glaucopus]|nr:hypothetical protein BYT27DRAFT_6807694 [Phlegmacium glaucopus]